MLLPRSGMPDPLGAPDEELSGRIKQGDRAAENELVRRFSGRVLAMAVVRLRDRETAREIVDDVMMAAVMALRNGTVRDTARLGAYIHGITMNLLRNHLRTQYRTPRTEPISDEEADPRAAESGERDIDMQTVRRCLEQLPLRDRQVLFMTLVNGLKPGEIASRLGLTSDVVRQQKGRALKRLRDMIDGSSQTILCEPLGRR